MLPSTMNGWLVSHHGAWQDVLEWREDIPTPTPPDNGCVIQVEATGVNFADQLVIANEYQVRSDTPFVPGFEAVGSVVATDNPTDYPIGARICGFGFRGAFAEYMPIEANFGFAVDSTVSDTDAAGLVVTYHTSFFALERRARLQADETLVVLGAAGGVGSTAVQLGKLMGATVIAVVSDEAKAAHAKSNGADHVIVDQPQSSSDGFQVSVNSLTNGNGADVIFDPVGADLTYRATKCIGFEGRLITIGFAGGMPEPIAVNRIMVKNFSIVGLNWPNYGKYAPETLAQAQSQLLQWVAAGDLKPAIAYADSLQHLPNALQAINDRSVQGKIILNLNR